MRAPGGRGPSAVRFVRFWASGELSSQKWEILCLPWTPINCRAKCDTYSFIIGREIRSRTNTQTHKQTVTDISTHCLSACVDNNWDFLAFFQLCTKYSTATLKETGAYISVFEGSLMHVRAQRNDFLHRCGFKAFSIYTCILK